METTDGGYAANDSASRWLAARGIAAWFDAPGTTHHVKEGMTSMSLRATSKQIRPLRGLRAAARSL